MANPVDPLGERVALAEMAGGGLAAFRRNLRISVQTRKDHGAVTFTQDAPAHLLRQLFSR